jgi:tyrosinase
MSSSTLSRYSMEADQQWLLRSSSPENDLDRHERPSKPKRHIVPVLLLLLLLTVAGYITSDVILNNQLEHPFRIPKLPHEESCDFAPSRPSWHSLPRHRRHAFIRAVQRLASKPSRLGLRNTSMYDDFVYVHTQIVWQVHHHAISLPFHRYFVHVFEQVLQNEGGYDGLMPYWDWTRDSGDPLASSVWDSWAGFGSAGNGCISDGPFARVGKSVNYTEDGYEPHCVTRNCLEDADESDGIMHSKHWTPEVVDAIVDNSSTYTDFRQRLEEGPHKHLHTYGIGGDMASASSPNG